MARYFAKPRERVRTERAGWMNDPANVQYDETIDITLGLKKRDLQAKIVLNLSEKKVEINGWTGERDFDKLFDYFFKGYQEYLTRVMKGLDPEYLERAVQRKDGPLETENKESAEPSQ